MFVSSSAIVPLMRYKSHPHTTGQTPLAEEKAKKEADIEANEPESGQGNARDSFGAQRLTAIKSTTRDELYRRLLKTREYIDDNFTKELDLEKLAEVACLSPHYLLRLFKQVFHKTPHQYVTELRLEYASTLLASTNLPITQVCFEVGYSSLGSFSDLFRRKMGLSPMAYRRAQQLERPSDAPPTSSNPEP